MGKGRDKRKRIEKRKQGAPRAQAQPGESLGGDPEAHVRSPLKPKPGLLSGAMALPEPEEQAQEGAVDSVRLPRAGS
jgi:hypothetical protein